MADTFSLVILSALFGFTIKIADLLNEHGLRWFYGDALAFGALWGISGSLLVLSDVGVANVVLAMVLAFIIEMRIDYFNHALGTVLIIIAFIAASAFDAKTFFVFFASFVFFGVLRAYIGDVRKKKDLLFKLSEPGWAHYYIVPFLWGIYSGTWLIFLAFATYRTCYNIAKYGLYWKGVYSEL